MFSISKVTAVMALTLSSSLAVPAPGDRVGSATLYHPSGPGVCGTTPKSTDRVVSVSKALFDQFGNTTLCDAFVFISSPNFVAASIHDQCVNCGTNDILLSSAAFSVLADPAVGIIETVDWGFLRLGP